MSQQQQQQQQQHSITQQQLHHHHQQHQQHQQHQPQYVHYTGPPGANTTQFYHHHPQQQQQQQQQQAHVNGSGGVAANGPSSSAATTIQPSSTYSTPATANNAAASSLSSSTTTTAQVQAAAAGAAPQSTTAHATPAPLFTAGDWTKDLVQLAKQAELKKHALTLQLHTAHIMSAHASIEQKRKAIEDIKEQKNKLDAERARLLRCLVQVNEDRDKADLLKAQIDKDCKELENKIQTITEGEYSITKRDVDRLRGELGQPPLPSVQATLEEKNVQYLNERRINGASSSMTPAAAVAVSSNTTSLPAPIASNTEPAYGHFSTSALGKRDSSALTSSSSSFTTATATAATVAPATAAVAGSSTITSVNGAAAIDGAVNGQAVKRPRGRPKGSKNRAKITPGTVVTTVMPGMTGATTTVSAPLPGGP